MLILPIVSTKPYLTVFTGIKVISDVSLTNCSFLARLLHLNSMSNKGMAISTGKFGTLIGFDTCQDGEVK
jgi:hypothetical protein